MTTTLRLAAILAERHMTQSELARQTRLSFQAVNHMCSGRARAISLDTVDRLAKVLEVEPGDLFERKAKGGKA